jgi:hypothetical protein
MFAASTFLSVQAGMKRGAVHRSWGASGEARMPHVRAKTNSRRQRIHEGEQRGIPTEGSLPPQAATELEVVVAALARLPALAKDIPDSRRAEVLL